MELEDRLEEVDDNGSESVLLDTDFVEDVVTGEGRSLDDLTESLFDHSGFYSVVEGELERSLYELGSQGRVEYQRGSGWRLRIEE